MTAPFLTGLGRVLDSAGVRWIGVPGWETRTGYTDRKGRPRGYDEVYGAILHTTDSDDSAFAKAAAGDRAYWDPQAPTLDVVTDRWGTRGAHTYNMLIARDGTARLIAAGPGWQAGRGTWPTKVAGPNPGVPDNEANFHTIGLSMDANGSKYPPTEAQLVTLVKILVQLKKEWSPGRFEVIMHGEWQPVGYPGAEGRTDPTGVPGGWGAIRKAVDAGAWPVKSTTATKTAASGTVPVVIRRGDVLWQIARDLHTTVAAIQAATPGLDPDRIRPGQIVHVPARRHTVQAGDTLGAIAAATGATVQELARVNGIPDPNRITRGQTLVVPA